MDNYDEDFELDEYGLETDNYDNEYDLEDDGFDEDEDADTNNDDFDAEIDDYDTDTDNYNSNYDVTDNNISFLGMTPEEAGYADGEFDANSSNSEYSSFGASIDLDELDDDERDDYESSYLAGYDMHKK